MKTASPAGWLLLSILSLLTACGGEDPASEAPRPVLVVRPDAAGETGEAFPGTVRAREESALAFRVGGKLVRRHVDTGTRVRRGQLLAELDPGDLDLQAQAAQAQLTAAEAERIRLQGDLDRYAVLLEQQLISRSAYDAQRSALAAAREQARSARAQMEVARNQAGYARLLAPDDGAIAGRHAEAGQVVAAGQTVFDFAADGGREVAIDLPESRIRGFRIGQPAEIELWNAPGRRLAGRIREIAPSADAQTRTYAARVSLDEDAAAVVELGQSARVYFKAGHEAAALAVPLTAVQRADGERPVVWVVRGGRAVPVPVRLGPYGSTQVPVLEGLSADDWVVAGGGHLLREGQPVVPVDRSNRPIAPAKAD